MSLSGRPWAEVRAELFGEPYLVWHDGPEFSGLREVWAREPDALLEQLFAGMAEGDPLAAQSLSELEPAPTGAAARRVIDVLREHCATTLLRWRGIEAELDAADAELFGWIATEDDPKAWARAADRLADQSGKTRR